MSAEIETKRRTKEFFRASASEERTNAQRLRAIVCETSRQRTTAYRIGGSCCRASVSATAKACVADFLEGLSSSPFPFCVFCDDNFARYAYIPKNSTWVCFGSRGESRRKAQFYCCRLGILPCFIFSSLASALLARVLSIAIIIAARRDKKERSYSQAKDGRRKFQPFVRC